MRLAELFASGRINAPRFDSRFWELFSSLQEISDTDFAVLDDCRAN